MDLLPAPGAGTGADAAGRDLGPTQGTELCCSIPGVFHREQGPAKGKAAAQTARMEQEPNHKAQPQAAFSVLSVPGEPQSLMKTGSLWTMEMLLQFLHSLSGNSVQTLQMLPGKEVKHMVQSFILSSKH